MSKPHHHIRWLNAGLDWERFSTREEAEASARQLARPAETYAIVQYDDETCPQCQRLMKQRLSTGDTAAT
jgi:hypothetical protein